MRGRFTRLALGTLLATTYGCVSTTTKALSERVGLLEEKVARLEADVGLLESAPDCCDFPPPVDDGVDRE